MERYKVNKIGFVNFWLYDEEEFYFYDGKLLLRGTNGSGKTVTMQSFFPLIFDGNKSPERLDPFGSRDRRIEHYLISDDFDGNENTGYIYMEFYNKELNKYLTIGIGLRAIRNRNTEFWGFAITDNRRIGKDFLLFRERNLRTPLTKKELQTRIGTGGEFVETSKDYKLMVNKLLFDFKNIDLYTEFINLMIQVRSPKLSNSTRPRELTKILSSVLEPLSEEELREMADSIENMNKYKETLYDLQNEYKACESFKKTYDEYNSFILYSKGEQYLNYKQNLNSLLNNIKDQNIKEENLKDNIKINKDKKVKLELEQKDLENRKANLEETDLKNISSKLGEILETLKELETNKKSKQDEKDIKEKSLNQYKKDLKNQEDELFKINKQFESLISELSDLEEDIDFDDVKIYLSDLKRDKYNFNDIDSFLITVKKQIELLNVIKDKVFKLNEKEIEINSEKEKYSQISDKISKQKNKINSISKSLSDIAGNFKDYVANFSSNNKVFKLEDIVLNEIYNVIENLSKEYLLQIKEILKNQVYLYKDSIDNSIRENNIKINELKIKLDNLNIELDNISNILTSNLSNDETIKYFEENKINYNYLFKLIEFKDNIDINVRKNIESFLFDSGILTSFVVNTEIKDINVKAKCLEKDIKVENNLLSIINPLNTEFKDKVKDILESISILDSGNIKVLDNGFYKFSLISGKTDINYELKYIGESTREKYISDLKEKNTVVINTLVKEIDNLTAKNIILKNNLEILNQEFNNFNFDDTLFMAINDLELANAELSKMNNDSDEIINIIRNKTNEFITIKDEIENIKGYNGSLIYDEVLETLNSTKSYLETLNKIPNLFSNFKTREELVNRYRDDIEDKYLDIDNLNAELGNIDFKISDINNRKIALEEILNSDKYRDVAEEYAKIKNRLIELKDEIPNMIEIISRDEVNLDNTLENIEKLNIEIKKLETLKNVTYKIFIDEYNLNYISNNEIKENEIYHFVKSLKPNNNIILRDIQDKFNDAASKYLSLLTNYSSKYTILHLSNIDDYLNFTDDVELKDEINKLLKEAERRDLIFNYKGKAINLIDLSNNINSSISSYKDFISAENRKLFEDLLINNLGMSIRNKINESEEWIEEVKKLMESLNTTSGLSFSIKWVGVEPITEDEVETSEIVKLLKTDSKMLKDSDLEKISNHFRSKISRIEETLEESERNYLEIIKDVLDYRKWFEFKLFFKRGGKDKKELTDREFNKMSGGEKAIAMYIPLFASIFAKLKGASKTAPKIIALDEAFAGVDDDNIKDAFRILDKLDIDFVLTSQQLWGDYETIKHLAISELHHPVDSKVVSIIKYKWDGISRNKVIGEEDYEC